MRDVTGKLPPFPGIFPDYAAPIVRNAPDGVSGEAVAGGRQEYTQPFRGRAILSLA
jgi:hypothetical protein